VRKGTAYWIERDGQVWLVRRAAKGLLGGMTALPGPEWTGEDASHGGAALAQVRHIFTHFALDLSIVALPEPSGAGWWQSIHGLDSAGLPTVYRKAVEAVLAGRTKAAAA
jgi:A/G-specific adenine glycosylase